MTVLSLFDGISCARVALDRLGYRDILYLASEVDKYAIQIAQKNYPDTIQLGDVCKIQRDMLPQHIDLLIGGSPCQDLSIAKNNRKGLDGERSGLFWEWVRLWKECQPTYWVLENVNSMPKEARRIISETLGVEPIMINAALVSAQNRKRLFWTNIATDVFGNCHIPQPEDRGILLKHILESGTAQNEINKAYCIYANYFKGGKKDIHNQSGKRLMVIDNNDPKMTKPIRIGDIGSNAQGQRVYSTDGKSVTLSAMGGAQGAQTGLYAVTKLMVIEEIYPSGGQNGKARAVAMRSRTRHHNHADEKYEKLPEISGEKANAMTSVQTDSMVAEPVEIDHYNGHRIVPDNKAKTLDTNPQCETAVAGQSIMQNYIIRKLTPVECERLQSLDDNYTEGISNTQRYKCLGNAFNAEVVRHILSYMEAQ
jgi:DNA-cytosine methyltransferase